jgi:predicted dehydrogenase
MMIRIGLIGIGFMGMTHFAAAKHLKGGKVTAIMSRDPKKQAGDWSGIQGNFGPPGEKNTNLKGVKIYADIKALLDDAEIDLVDICLPTQQHEAVVLEALRADKHVMVEKPLAITSKSADRMLKVAHERQRTLLVGHVLPYFAEFAFVAQAVQSGKYGKLLSAHFKRIIAPPEWSSDMAMMENNGGYGIDLHIHDNHFIRMICGQPQAVTTVGIIQQQTVAQAQTVYHYGVDGPGISCISGGLAAKGLSFGHGYELFFEKATIQFDAGNYAGNWTVNRPVCLIDQQGKVTAPKIPADKRWCQAFERELQHAIDVLTQNKDPQGLSARVATDALLICEAEKKSLITGKTVKLAG